MRVVVAIDGTECSSNAVEYLARRPWADDDAFLVVSVTEQVPVEVGFGHPPYGVKRFDKREFEECKKFAARACGRIKEALPKNQVESNVLVGAIADQICQCARSWDADLIVVGTHGRKGLSRFFLGSVAEEVLRESPCSVEVIKAGYGRAPHPMVVAIVEDESGSAFHRSTGQTPTGGFKGS